MTSRLLACLLLVGPLGGAVAATGGILAAAPAMASATQGPAAPAGQKQAVPAAAHEAARPGVPPALGDYLAATVAMQSNDFDFAAEHMLRALAADPRDPSLLAQTFLATSLAGRPEAVRLASALPGRTNAILALGNALVANDGFADAAREFASLPHDGGIADALRPVLVAWCEAGSGRTDEALATLAPLASGMRLPSFYALNEALIADLAGRTQAAAQAYHVAQTTAPGLNLALVRVLASFEARHGRLAEGEALVHALTSSVPTLAIAERGIDGALAQAPVAGARQGIGRAYGQIAALVIAQASQAPGASGQGGSDQDGADGPATPGQGDTVGNVTALLMLRDAQALDPHWSETLLVESDVEQTMHDDDAALATLAAIPASDPLSALVRLRQAELEEALGDADQARAGFQALVAAYPGDVEPARELGEMLSDEHRYGEAVTAFDRAIADTGHPTGDDWELFFDRAVAYDRSHQWSRADADLRHALALSPEQPYVLNYLGYSEAEQDRDLGDARHMLERALDQKPHDGAFLDSLGWIILRQGDVPGAIATLQSAAELTPEDPTVNYHLGVAYWQAGRRAEAEEQWQRALILKPDADDLPKIEARLHEADAAPAARPGTAATVTP